MAVGLGGVEPQALRRSGKSMEIIPQERAAISLHVHQALSLECHSSSCANTFWS